MAQGVKLTLRERNKLEKLQRIKAASRRLFSENGFQETSTRNIAMEADVGLATLFKYAKNKQDLLFLAFNDDICGSINDDASSISSGKKLADNIITTVSGIYIFFGQNKTLGKSILSEIPRYTDGLYSSKMKENISAIIGKFQEAISMAQSNQEITSDISKSDLAKAFFHIYSAEVKIWLYSDEAGSRAGLDKLKHMLDNMKIAFSYVDKQRKYE